MGHGGDGKTSLVESLLNIAGVTDRVGKIADGNTVCDFDPEEIKRKFSISTAVAPVDPCPNLSSCPAGTLYSWALCFAGAILALRDRSPSSLLYTIQTGYASSFLCNFHVAFFTTPSNNSGGHLVYVSHTF